MFYIMQGFFLFPNINEFNDFIVGTFSTAIAAASVFGARLLPEQHEDVEVFTTDTMLLTATCSCFCTRLLEFSSMSLCKFSFSSSTYPHLPLSVLKKIDAIFRSSDWEMFYEKGVLFCQVSMMWTLVDLLSTKSLFSLETCFFSQIILPEIRTGSFSNKPGDLVQ